jgi:hypothetical protein
MADFLNLKAILSLNNSGFISGIKQSESSAKNFSKNLKQTFGGSFQSGAGGGFLGSLLGVGASYIGLQKINSEVDRFIEKMKQVKEESAKTGLDSETVQKVMNVGDINKAGNSLERIAEVQAQILEGSDTNLKLTKAFALLGVSLDDLKNKNHQQIFFQIAEAMKEARVNAEQLNAIGLVLGGKGDDLMPMFRKGMDSVEATAGVISNEDVDEIEKIQKMRKEINGPATSLLQQIKYEAVKMIENLKLGLSGIPQLPSIFMEMPETFLEGRGKAVRAMGSKRVEARQAAKAQAQIEAEERRIAAVKEAEEEAERQKKLSEKVAAIREKNKTAELRNHIKVLTKLGGFVGDDIESILSPDNRALTSWQKGGEGARMSNGDRKRGAERLIALNEAIKAELQRANMELQKLNSKGEE